MISLAWRTDRALKNDIEITECFRRCLAERAAPDFCFCQFFLSNGKVHDLHNIFILRNSYRNGMIESVVFVDMCQYMSMKCWMQILVG